MRKISKKGSLDIATQKLTLKKLTFSVEMVNILLLGKLLIVISW